MNYDIIETHRGNIHIGDTIVVDGVLKTVGRNNISQCPLLGRSEFMGCLGTMCIQCVNRCNKLCVVWHI